VVEYLEALKLHKDAATRAKLNAATAKLDKQYYPIGEMIEPSRVSTVTPPNSVHSTLLPANLASLLKQLADYMRDLDEEIKRQWRQIQERLPEDTPALLKSMWLDHSLAQATDLEESANRLEFEGDPDSYRKAESLYKQAAAIRQKNLGEDEPDALLDLVYAARIMAAQNRFDDAVELDEQTLATFRKSKHKGWQYQTI
jgi:hypothetical protein